MNRAINLSGKMSILGVTKLSPKVMEQMLKASNEFYLIKDLRLEVEENISKHFGASETFITSSATAGIVSTILAVREKLTKQKENRKVKVLLAVGHHIDYGAPIKKIIELAGAEVLPIGNSNKLDLNDLENSLTLNPDIAFYVSSHHAVQKEHIGPQEFNKFYKDNKISTAIDIAAEEDVWTFLKYGFTYTILSGSKAISGPTSGMVFIPPNEKELFDSTLHNEGRCMKLGKENIVGLNQAVLDYSKERKLSQAEKDIDKYIDTINKETNLNAEKNIDKKRNISRILISTKDKKDIFSLIDWLHKNSIYTREYMKNIGKIELDLRQTNEEEMSTVINILKGEQNG